MRKAGNTAILVCPIQYETCVLVPQLLRPCQTKVDDMAAKRLMGVLRVYGVPMPLGVPVHDPSGR